MLILSKIKFHSERLEPPASFLPARISFFREIFRIEQLKSNDAAISIRMRVKKTELFKTTLTKRGYKLTLPLPIASFHIFRIPLFEPKIWKGGIIPFRHRFIVRLISKPFSKILLAGIGDEKWRSFRQICFVLTTIPVRRFITACCSSFSTSFSSSPPLDKRTPLSPSTRAGHPVELFLWEIRGVCWAATFFTIAVENRGKKKIEIYDWM